MTSNETETNYELIVVDFDDVDVIDFEGLTSDGKFYLIEHLEDVIYVHVTDREVELSEARRLLEVRGD
jgi:hypothetical protein